MEATEGRKKQSAVMNPEELRAAREEMRLTQQEAADKYGLSLRGYKNYELGQKSIPTPIRLLTQYFLRDHRKIEK